MIYSYFLQFTLKRVSAVIFWGKESVVVGAIFMLKNRFPNEWRDKRELEVKKEEEKTLTLDEQIAKVELMRSQLLQIKAGQDAKVIEVVGQ